MANQPSFVNNVDFIIDKISLAVKLSHIFHILMITKSYFGMLLLMAVNNKQKKTNLQMISATKIFALHTDGRAERILFHPKNVSLMHAWSPQISCDWPTTKHYCFHANKCHLHFLTILSKQSIIKEDISCRWKYQMVNKHFKGEVIVSSAPDARQIRVSSPTCTQVRVSFLTCLISSYRPKINIIYLNSSKIFFQ